VEFIVTVILILTSIATIGAAAATHGVDSRDADPPRGTDHRA
jgi:hypothetical protein